MNSSVESHAGDNGVATRTDPEAAARRERFRRAVYAGASAGLRTFTVPSTALRVKDNAWAPLFGSLARTELIFDKLPTTPSRLQPRGLGFRAIAAATTGAALATRKDPAWLALAAAATVTAMATAFIGATIRIKGAERRIPDFILAAIEDQCAIHWAAEAFPTVEPEREVVPAITTLSLL